MPEAATAAITVDLEEWYHVCTDIPRTAISSERVVQTTDMVLKLLRKCGVRATFFMLGEVAHRHPDLAPRIVQDGHELASHGWSHSLVTDLSPDMLQEELERTASLLKEQAGVRPLGFRAPRWSLCRQRTPWAFDLLKRLGYWYDSSLTPLPLIGDPHGPLAPYRIVTPAGELWELPPMVTRTWLGNLPTGGGWGLRFFPYRLIRMTMEHYAAQRTPAVLFIHPRELDPQGPRLPMGPLRSFVTYGPRRSCADRLERLLGQFRFEPLGEMVARWQSVS